MRTLRTLAVAGTIGLASTLASLAPAAAQDAVPESGQVADDPNLLFRNVQRDECMLPIYRPQGNLFTKVAVGQIDDWPNPGSCSRNTTFIWEFHRITSVGGTPLYQVRHPVDSPDLCLSIEGHEGGDTHVGDDARLEPCEAASTPFTQRDDLFYREHLSNGNYRIRHYVQNHRDLALQADPNDGNPTNGIAVQLWELDGAWSIEWRFETPE
jgi:hypothetical protein